MFHEISVASPDDKLYSKIVDPLEKELFHQVMQSCKSKTKAAERLGINRNTLHKKLKDFGLDKGGEN